jgi:ubiquinone/menaquinone biosynthesis C-methylase UbiE
VTEFTGERVVPGAVNPDLWAEHIARYAFAAKYASGKVLDAGCGTGYGTGELARHASLAVGIDVSADAVDYASTHQNLGNTRFAQASVTALPFQDAAFDTITAFEVIEHIEDWPRLIAEARRVLDPRGVFLVSTPNQLYYTESRGSEGPNPFHVHEFTFAEFRDALTAVFPHVIVMQQNRTEAFAFLAAANTKLDAQSAASSDDPDQAHFFIAICGIDRPPEPRGFVYLPSGSNLLRERERHIRLLEGELQLTKDSLARSIAEHKQLVDLHTAQTEQLEERNRWALKMETDWRSALERVAQLQEELKAEQKAGQETAAAYAAKVTELEDDVRLKTQWALDTEQRLSAELAAKCQELFETVRLLDQAETTVTERTVWAQGLEKQVAQLEAQLAMIRESRWIKLGRMAGLGPRVPE